MLKVDYRIQLDNGKFVNASIVKHKYSVKYSCEYIVFLSSDNPPFKLLVPLIKQDDQVFIDYSFDEDSLQDLASSFSIPSFSKLPNELLSYQLKFRRVSASLNTTIFEMPKINTKLVEAEILKKDDLVELPKEVSASKKEEKIEEEENTILFIRLDNKQYMFFKVVKEDKNNYICRRITEEDFLGLKEECQVIRSTFSTRNYYKLQDMSNITTANKLPTKIAKELVIDDAEMIHALIVKYKNKCYEYFVIKVEMEEQYVVEPTTYEYIKSHPFDITMTNLESETDYQEFRKVYDKIVKTGQTMVIPKENQPVLEETKVRAV